MEFMVIVAATPENKIAKWQPDFGTKEEADAFVESVKANYPKAFVVANPPAFGMDFATVNMDEKTFVFDNASYDAQQVKDDAQSEIEKLEGSITKRRLLDAFASDEGKAWIAAIEEKIATERSKL